MLTKAARPLFRAHAAAPDLFTSNPSLLHHLPANGVGNSLVSTAQSSASAGGGPGSAGAGRAGGYSAGSGGYSGPARAFLSLPQTTHTDATSSLSDERDRQRAARLRLPPRFTAPASSAHDLRSRAAPTVRLVDVDDAAPRFIYPAWERPTLGGGVRPQQRALSTSASPRALVAAPSEATAESRRIGGANRVLMDLAGVEVARPVRPTQIRRNSTAYIPQSADAPPPPLPSRPADENDQAIHDAIHAARTSGQREVVHVLVRHYRTPRGAAVESESEARIRSAPTGLTRRYALPAGYTVRTYNACLQAVLDTRQRGDSIAPVLDMYNEMLARDLIPTPATYGLVVRALCLRELDIANAARRYEGEREWKRYRAEVLGEPAEPEADGARQAIEAYKNEGNLENALTLFRSALAFSTARRPLSADIYQQLIDATAVRSPPSADVALELLRAAQERNIDGVNTLYGPVFRALGAGKQAVALQAVWQEYGARQNSPAAWGKEDVNAERVAALEHAAVRDAVRGFVLAGDVDKALGIFTVHAATLEDLNSLVFGLARARHTAQALAWFEKSLDAEYTASLGAVGATINASAVAELADALALGGDVNAAVRVVCTYVNTLNRIGQPLVVARPRFVRLYAIVLAAARADARKLPLLSALVAAVPIRFDADLAALHVELLVGAGLYAGVAPALDAFTPRPLADGTAPALRRALDKLILSDADLASTLAAVGAFARHRETVGGDNDAPTARPVGVGIVDKYLLARAAAGSAKDLDLSSDAWFRLITVVGALPADSVETVALERLMDDLAELNTIGFPLREGVAVSPAVTDLVQLLHARFGRERATALATAAFGELASPQLPELVDQAFSIPPTPESTPPLPKTPQPRNAHTLHISPELSSALDKHIAPRPDLTARQAYARVQHALTARNAVPHPHTLGRLIATLGREGDGARARELYALGQVVLTACANATDQADGWRALEDAMLVAACHLGELEAAGVHRARLIEAGMSPSADAYATMIASAKDTTDDAAVARELWDESQRLGVRPHLYLYNTVISRLSKARKAEGALELFAAMKNAGIRPSSVTYGAVINACCRVGDAESAATLFEEMSSMPNFKPRVPPYNTMMQFHLHTRPSRDLVLAYHAKMRAAGVAPSAHTYKLLLDAYGTLAPADLEAMERVFAELAADRAVKVAGTHWASLVTAYGVAAGDKERALAVFERYAAHPTTTDPTPEPVVWEAAIGVLGHAAAAADESARPALAAELDALVARMHESGARSTAYVANALIAAHARLGDLDRARAVFAAMGDSVQGVAAPNNHPQLHTSAGHAKPVTRTQYDTATVFREPSTYEAMARAEAAAGNREAAEGVLAMMEERRYPVAVWLKARAVLDEVHA
ncbi:hypothetical protein Q5752_005858 [Cryptotrichosporon argae]